MSTYLKVKVDYSIVVTVRYRTFCHVRRTKTIRQELLFRSEPIIADLKSSTIGSLPANTLYPTTSQRSGGADCISSAHRDWLPPYSPSLRLQVSLSSPPIIEVNQETPIRLIFYTPPELLEGSALYLRSIAVELRSSVAVFFGNVPFELVETAHCWSSRGAVRIDQKRFDLESGSWGKCIVARALPTCSSCLMELRHAIVVTAAISKGDNPQLQVSFFC